MLRNVFSAAFAGLVLTGFALSAKPQPKAATAAAAPEETLKSESKVKDSKFRLQIGIMTGVQTNPIQSNQYVQDDVTTMNTTVNAINSTSSSPQAQIQAQSAVVYAVPVGLSIQTVFFDFLRVRLHGTYDFPITMTNQFTDKSSGIDKTFTSDLRVTQIQMPLLFMFDIPISKENTIYIGGGPTLYWGRIEKNVSEAGAATSTTAAYTKNDIDRIEGLAYGPTFIIGMQRRIGTMVSVHVDVLYQSGARGGFVDKLQNTGLSSSTDKPGGFSDLNNNPGDEKKTDGSHNQGSPKIMNFEGIRLLFGLNLHVDF